MASNTAAAVTTQMTVTRVHATSLAAVFPGYHDHYMITAEGLSGHKSQAIHFESDEPMPIGATITVTIAETRA